MLLCPTLNCLDIKIIFKYQNDKKEIGINSLLINIGVDVSQRGTLIQCV